MISAIPKGRAEDRPPPVHRRYTIRDRHGIPLAHGRTPAEAMADVSTAAAWLEERDARPPQRVWHRISLLQS